MRTRSLVLIGLVLVVGCGGPKYAPVSGTVTMDGNPLANVAVSFQPIAEGELSPGPGSSGRTNEKGEYTLTVIGGGPGAVVGWHRVEINNTVTGDPDEDRRLPVKNKGPRVLAKYNLQSDLKFEVKPGENKADFELFSK